MQITQSLKEILFAQFSHHFHQANHPVILDRVTASTWTSGWLSNSNPQPYGCPVLNISVRNCLVSGWPLIGELWKNAGLHWERLFIIIFFKQIKPQNGFSFQDVFLFYHNDLSKKRWSQPQVKRNGHISSTVSLCDPWPWFFYLHLFSCTISPGVW